VVALPYFVDKDVGCFLPPLGDICGLKSGEGAPSGQAESRKKVACDSGGQLISLIGVSRAVKVGMAQDDLCCGSEALRGRPLARYFGPVLPAA
jgi:hypothetical protein